MHDADQRVDLREVPAVGAELLPDVGDRVEADDVDAAVAHEEHVGGHVVEDHRVLEVKIPLVRVELGHDDLAGLLAPGEVARSRRREHLRHRLLVLVRDGPVVKEEIPVLVLLLSRSRPLCPFVILTRVVHDEVEADADALLMALSGKSGKVLDGSEGGIHLAEIGDRVAAVALPLGDLHERHHVQVVDAALLDVIELLFNALEVPREAVDVHLHAEHVIGLVPVGILGALCIPLLESRRARRVVLVEHLAEIVKCLHIIVVKLCVKPFHLVVGSLKSFGKLRLPVLVDHTYLLGIFHKKSRFLWCFCYTSTI